MLKDIQPPYDGPSSFLKEMELLKSNDEFVMYLWKSDEHIQALRKMGYDINQNVLKVDCYFVEICAGKVTNSYGKELSTNCPKFENWGEMVKYVLGIRRTRKNVDLLFQKFEEKEKPKKKEEPELPEGLREYAVDCAFPHVAKFGDGQEFLIRGMTKRELVAMHILSSWRVNEFAEKDEISVQVRAALDYADVFLEEVKRPKVQ